MFTFAVMVLYLSSLNPKHFDEDVLLRLAFLVLSYFNARPYFPFSSLCLVISLLMQFSRCSARRSFVRSTRASDHRSGRL